MIKPGRISFYFFLLMSIIATACSSSNDVPEQSAKFSVSESSLSFLKSGGSQTVYVESASTPSATSDAEWLKVDNIALNGTSQKIYKLVLTADANTVNDDRTATVKVASGSNSATINVTQVAKDGLVIETVTPDPTSLDYTATDLTVTFLCNTEYTITPADSWVSVDNTQSRAAMTSHNVTLKVSANGTSTARETTVVFAAGDATETITVKQAGFSSTNMQSNARELAKKIYAGWNIGNTLEAYNGTTPSETAWGNPTITESLIKSIKAAGFNAVRLPTAWDGYIEDRSTYKIKDSWLNRIYEIVGWCVANDMYVIVNIHWDGGWLEENCTNEKKAENIKEQKALWTQIANKLGGYDEHLLFAGANEPNVDNAEEMAVLLEYEQTFIDAVRATGGNNYKRTLIVQAPATDIDKSETLFTTMPTDVVENRLMAEVHYYAPWQFCGLDSDESWGKVYYFWGSGNHITGSDRNAQWGEEDYLSAEFDKVQKQFVNKGIPVILGEYGAIKDRSSLITDATELAAHKQSRYDFNMKVTREAKNHGMVPFMWDTGEGMSRTSGAVTSDVIIPAVIAGAKAGNYPF
jgi:aryl-phospho-beta-D-glucosidase BglC (GH1 family)